jgi:cytochrome c551/c552
MYFRWLNGGALLAGALLVVSLPTLSGASIPGDAQAGKQLFNSQKCNTCHRVLGQGGKSASDLGKSSGRGYTPVDMVAAMWNHAPQMFPALDRAGIAKPALTSAQVADLFAYFYAARYFEKPGDAGRGRKLFVSKGCVDCHNVSSANAEGGTPVMAWQSVADPIELARQMWNHAARMTEAMAKKKINPPVLTAVEMTDIVLYLQTLPQTKNLPPQFAPASAETGEMLFQVKGCQDCHQGAASLARRATLRSNADFATALWNHSAKMVQMQPALRPEEMKRLVGYLWSLQFDQSSGDVARGKAVFTAKGCVTCHAQGYPNVTKLDAFDAVASLWLHAPGMLKAMREKNVNWPRFTGGEVTNLLAYINRK